MGQSVGNYMSAFNHGCLHFLLSRPLRPESYELLLKMIASAVLFWLVYTQHPPLEAPGRITVVNSLFLGCNAHNMHCKWVKWCHSISSSQPFDSFACKQSAKTMPVLVRWEKLAEIFIRRSDLIWFDVWKPIATNCNASFFFFPRCVFGSPQHSICRRTSGSTVTERNHLLHSFYLPGSFTLTLDRFSTVD